MFQNQADGIRYSKTDGLGYQTLYSYRDDWSFNTASNNYGNVTIEQDALGYTVDTTYQVEYKSSSESVFKMICRAFQVRLNGRISRAMSLCLILNILSLIGGGAVAQTSTSGLKDNSAQEFFDPNGYYFPGGEGFVFGGWKIESIDIEALKYHYDNELHYDRPRSIPPVVHLIFTRQKDQKKFTYKCPNPVVSKEVLTVFCPTTPIGRVSIRGSFLDKQGQYWNRSEIVPYKTIVLAATVTIENKRGHQASRQISFTYWEGH